MINIVLSGDNAVIIALAVRNVPKALQKRAIFWGTFGAIALRIVFAVLVVWLLKIPLLMFIGGLLLLQIAYKLIAGSGHDDHSFIAVSGDSMRGAIKTIIFADAIMSLDNVLALAGVAGSLIPIFLGILLSVPIIIWGSQIILILLEKFPIIAYLGAALLAWTAGEMMMKDEMISRYVHHEGLMFVVCSILTLAVLIAGYLKDRESSH